MTAWEEPRTRIVALAVALAAIVAVLAAVLIFWQPAEEDKIRSHVDSIIKAFEAREVGSLGDKFEQTFVLAVDGKEEIMASPAVRQRAQAIVDNHPLIRIRKVHEEIEVLPGGREAALELEFHVTASNTMYPGGRFRSEEVTEGRPLFARIGFQRQEDQWLINQVSIDTNMDSRPRY